MAPKQRNVVGSSSSSRVRVNPIVNKFVQRNVKSKITYDVQPESNENLKFSKLKREEKHAFRERLSKLQVRKFAKLCLVNWDVFSDYECEDELRKMMRMSYVYPGDGDTFEDYSWERAFSIYKIVFREWSLELFSTFYFERKVVDLMRETCIWFRLCGKEHANTLPGFAVALGLYEKNEVDHRLFEAHFVSLVRYYNDYEGMPGFAVALGFRLCTTLCRVLHFLLGYWNRVLHLLNRRDVWRDLMMMRHNYNYDYSLPMLQHLVREANYEVPPYNSPNVPPYPFHYEPYPSPYPYPYPGYAPFPEPVPVYGRVPEVGGSSFNVGGSSSGVGKKRQKVDSVFEDEDDEESGDERIHTPDDMEDDDE